MRTQETFGAATPGRRVLYSASWVLGRLRRGGGAHGTLRPRRRERQGRPERKCDNRTARPLRGVLRGEHLAAEQHGEDGRELLEGRRLERIVVVRDEVSVHAGCE